MKDELKDERKKYLGLPPFNGWNNTVYSDSYFYHSLCKFYGEIAVNKMIEQLRRDNK